MSVRDLESSEKPWIWLDQIQGLEILEFYKVVLNLIVVNKILFWLNFVKNNSQKRKVYAQK